ncbi:hypothetical protein STEG23_019482 [Scotinomys teguina]
MQPDRATNNGGRTMEVVAAAPRCQLLLIVLMAAMLLPGMKVSPLLIWRKIARTIELQENIGKDQNRTSNATQNNTDSISYKNETQEDQRISPSSSPPSPFLTPSLPLIHSSIFKR